MMKIFVDDIRNPPQSDWIVCRTYKKALEYITENIKNISIISLDHDLGKNSKTGYDLLKVLIDRHHRGVVDLSNVKVLCHSMNPVGKLNIEKTWSNFKKRYMF